jgi:thioredoxin-like negative regulator of GroEL
MIQSTENEQDFEAEASRFTVVRNGQRVKLSFAQLFAAGHRVWIKGDYQTAKQIFRQLADVSDRIPRAHIFLAHCLVMEGDYAGCSAVLHRALPKEQYANAASRLHDTFVLWKVGLFVDAKEGLKSLAMDFSELPTFSLMLADLLYQAGSESLSEKFLRRAIQLDRAGGGVSLSANSMLKSISQN